MNDSSVRESLRPASGSNDDPHVAALAAVPHRLSGSELACCCGLALRARELSGDRRCRVEISGGCPGAAAEDGPGWHRLPARGLGPANEPEARLAVELRGDESAPPGLERLSSLAAVAGLVLERHRLVREVRRARGEAEEARAVLGHALRGHLHAALLRADNLLLALREDGATDLGEVREQLRVLKGTVEEMVEEIRQVVEEPDVRTGASTRPPPEGREQVDVPELLQEAAGSERGGDVSVSVDAEGDVPAVRADPRQLASALGELLDLARASRSTPILSVRPDAASSGVRLDLTVESPPFSGRNDGPGEPEMGGSSSPRDAGRGEPAGGEGDEQRASLREVVDRLGGRLRVEVDEEGRVQVSVVLPAAE